VGSSGTDTFRDLQYPTAPLGDYDSGFPDEYAYEDFLARLEGLAEDERDPRGDGPAV
jgi:hypothetical protein